jgi:NAD(P)H-dependent flavin oxidoreductase YrpB (nitropropane dioxygenase family)
MMGTRSKTVRGGIDVTNPICATLDIGFPIFAFTHCRDVAAAVSRAGGVGALGSTPSAGDSWAGPKRPVPRSSNMVMDKLLHATSSDTVGSRALTGKPALRLRTAWTEAWEAPESPGTLPMPLQYILSS